MSSFPAIQLYPRSHLSLFGSERLTTNHRRQAPASDLYSVNSCDGGQKCRAKIERDVLSATSCRNVPSYRLQRAIKCSTRPIPNVQHQNKALRSQNQLCGNGDKLRIGRANRSHRGPITSAGSKKPSPQGSTVCSDIDLMISANQSSPGDCDDFPNALTAVDAKDNTEDADADVATKLIESNTVEPEENDARISESQIAVVAGRLTRDGVSRNNFSNEDQKSRSDELSSGTEIIVPALSPSDDTIISGVNMSPVTFTMIQGSKQPSHSECDDIPLDVLHFPPTSSVTQSTTSSGIHFMSHGNTSVPSINVNDQQVDTSGQSSTISSNTEGYRSYRPKPWSDEGTETISWTSICDFTGYRSHRPQICDDEEIEITSISQSGSTDEKECPTKSGELQSGSQHHCVNDAEREESCLSTSSCDEGSEGKNSNNAQGLNAVSDEIWANNNDQIDGLRRRLVKRRIFTSMPIYSSSRRMTPCCHIPWVHDKPPQNGAAHSTDNTHGCHTKYTTDGGRQGNIRHTECIHQRNALNLGWIADRQTSNPAAEQRRCFLPQHIHIRAASSCIPAVMPQLIRRTPSNLRIHPQHKVKLD